MSAEAGPGPSSMAWSPSGPSTAKHLRVKKRVINLVNPADPEEFSETLSPSASFSVRRREETPPVGRFDGEGVVSSTPSMGGVNKDGVKGILRSSGTPGSGNGVRFFPKNRFRIITPNHSMSTPTSNIPDKLASTPPPPASASSNSFLSQLLATIPSMSPRRTTTPPPESPPISPREPDESWEVPGQEGEVSLVVSSTVSAERSRDEADEDNLEEEEASWSGNPEIHSSPLGLPPPELNDPSRDDDDDGQEVELPSADLQVPEDMSNLLSQKFSPPSGVDSFSVSDFSRTLFRQRTVDVLPVIQSVSPVKRQSQVAWAVDDHDDSVRSTISNDANDSNPTIRRRLSPLPHRHDVEPETPTLTSKPFTSIFADMSAEQANLSWPLTRKLSASGSEVDEDDTAFPSALFAAPITELVDIPPIVTFSSTPLKAGHGEATPIGPGNVTEFFDCASPSPSPPVPSLTSSSNSVISRTPSPFIDTAHELVQPTKALFDAHSAHTTALAEELTLYRGLAAKLQAEVGERDGILANLNLRVIEGEMLWVKVDELDRELKAAKLRDDDVSSKFERKSSMSLPLRTTLHTPAIPQHAGDRTTMAEATNRDLEIRLAKALADQECLVSELDELRHYKDEQERQLVASRDTIKRHEDRERDAVVQAQRSGEGLRNQLETVTRRERALHASLKEAHASVEVIQREVVTARVRVTDLEKKIKEMHEVKMADEEEIGKLAMALDQAEDDHRQEVGEVKGRLREAKSQFEEANRAWERLDEEIQREREKRKTMEEQNEGLRARLLRLDAAEQRRAADSDEVARLRSESALKDLDITNLQRRKAELKEDVEMLNIALDSKQQELELMKRKYSVRGVAGSTPLASSRRINITAESTHEIETPAPAKMGVGSRRRSSMALVTPSFGSETWMPKGGCGTETRRVSSTRRGVHVDKVEEENRPPEILDSVRRDSRREGVPV